MDKIKITLRPEVLQILQAFARQVLANPGHSPTSGQCGFFALQEWILANVGKIHPPTPSPVRLSVKRSEAVALHDFLFRLGLTDIHQAFERDALLDYIGTKIPNLCAL